MDWFTILVQILNFAVLIFLLNIFLYKPLLKTINKRKDDIKKRIEEGEKELVEIKKLKDEYQKRFNESEQENEILREKMAIELKEIKDSELKNIKEDISNRRKKFGEYLELEEKSLMNNFYEKMDDLVIEYSNVILSSLANSSLEKEILNKFMEKIDEFDDTKVNEINASKSDIINIISSYKLDKKDELAIKDALVKKGFEFHDIEFVVDKNLILGVELRVKSYSVSWNIRDFAEKFNTIN